MRHLAVFIYSNLLIIYSHYFFSEINFNELVITFSNNKEIIFKKIPFKKCLNII